MSTLPIPTDDCHRLRPDRRWGACADELLHYTSRYYAYTEVFLRNLAARRDFLMAGYSAERLSAEQRPMMLAVLVSAPDRVSAEAAIQLVERVRDGDAAVEEPMRDRYRVVLQRIAHAGGAMPGHGPVPHVLPGELPPLDPFLALAERLDLPVRVKVHRVEVPFELLVQHLDSPTPQLRDNLQQAILWLHEAGYHLCNHPHLTHAQCRR